jgi:DNA-binding NarL/FixJ family response regulator
VRRGWPTRVSDVSTSVVLVDDHELIRQGLRRAFERTGDFAVVGEAGSVAQALEVIGTHQPDVVIFDVRLPDGSGLDAAKKVRDAFPAMGIVVLTMYAGDDQLFGALEAGASAFVPKDAPAEDVISAARHAAVSPRAFTANDLAGAMQRRLTPSGPQLSPREREVLGLLADGLGVAAISKQLYISESTTKTHISKVYEKLGAANRAQALMTAMRLGLIKNPADQDF